MLGYTPRADTPLGQTTPPLADTPLGDIPSRWLLLRTVRILLECILVFQMKIFRWKAAESNDKITIARYDFKQQALLVHHACEFTMKSMRNPCILTLQRTSNGTHKWNGKTVTEPNCKANAKAIFFDVCRCSMCTSQWILKKYTWKRCRFRFCPNINELLGRAMSWQEKLTHWPASSVTCPGWIMVILFPIYHVN